jgi:hypothetical protein
VKFSEGHCRETTKPPYVDYQQILEPTDAAAAAAAAAAAVVVTLLSPM